jgi:hypothetical protein
MVSIFPQRKKHLILYLTELEYTQVCLFEQRETHSHRLLEFVSILKNALIKLPDIHVKLSFVLQTIVWVVSVKKMLIEKNREF